MGKDKVVQRTICLLPDTLKKWHVLTEMTPHKKLSNVVVNLIEEAYKKMIRKEKKEQ